MLFEIIGEFVRKSFDKDNINRIHHSKKHDDFEYVDKKSIRVKDHKKITDIPKNKSKVNFNNHLKKQASDGEVPNNQSYGINESSGDIHFESNDLLDDYKK